MVKETNPFIYLLNLFQYIQCQTQGLQLSLFYFYNFISTIQIIFFSCGITVFFEGLQFYFFLFWLPIQLIGRACHFVPHFTHDKLYEKIPLLPHLPCLLLLKPLSPQQMCPPTISPANVHMNLILRFIVSHI